MSISDILQLSQVGVGTLAVFAIIYMIRDRIADRKAQAVAETSEAEQGKKILEMLAQSQTTLIDTQNKLAAAQKTQDTETAKAITIITEQLSENTKAVQDRTRYQEMQVTATQESVNELKALRIDLRTIPETTQSTIGALEMKIETGLNNVKETIVEGIQSLPEESGLKRYFTDITGKLDEILEQAKDNAGLIRALSGPPGHFPVPSTDLINAKRSTDLVPKVRPEDTDLKPTG